MNELIWFSIPGAVLVFAIDRASSISVSPILVVVIVPVLGFIVHQTFRVFFEAFGIWQCASVRPVLSEIVIEPAKDAESFQFHVWEVGLYSAKFPEPFRDHSRRAWHYILSFWSVTLAALIGSAVIAFVDDWIWAGILVAIGGLFALKGWQTYRSIVQQEVDAFHANRSVFEEIATQIRSSRSIGRKQSA